jgi:hypothetical protein
MPGISAPLFIFGGSQDLSANESHTLQDSAVRSFALTGKSVKADGGHLPVRGDLAHIRLAGLYFVPHYAVPMPRRIGGAGAALLSAGRADADVLCQLAAGSTFDVLDIAGKFAWGEFGENGPVGYVALDQLENVT